MTTVAPVHAAILRRYSRLNDAQRSVIAHHTGPLLVIAGPGSGKTLTLVLRTINLLLCSLAQPPDLVLCTFTEKAAFELRERIVTTARQLGYSGDMSALRVSTIHGLCNRFLTEHRHHAPLGSGYEVLDDLTQLLFIFEHFDEIVGHTAKPPYFGRWNTRWNAIKGLREYFNKITEELLEPTTLVAASDPFLSALAAAYVRYEELLYTSNRIDFAHQ